MYRPLGDFDLSQAQQASAGAGGEIDYEAFARDSGFNPTGLPVSTGTIKRCFKGGEECKEAIKDEARNQIVAFAPKAATGLCTMVGAPQAGPVCAKVGSYIGDKLSDVTDWTIDQIDSGLSKIFGKKRKPPILISPADAAQMTPEQVEYYGLVYAIGALYFDMLTSLVSAVNVIRDKQQVLLPGSVPWTPGFTLKVLSAKGKLPLAPLSSESYEPDFLYQYVDGVTWKEVLGPGGDTIRKPYLTDAQVREGSALMQQFEADYALVPPNLSKRVAQITGPSSVLPMKTRIALLSALYEGAEGWMRLLGVASASVLQTLGISSMQLRAHAAAVAMQQAMNAQAAARRQQGEAAAKSAEQQLEDFLAHRAPSKKRSVAVAAGAGIGLAWLLALL